MRYKAALLVTLVLATNLALPGSAAVSTPVAAVSASDVYPDFPQAALPTNGPGRPVIANGTVLTAWRTPLRGAFVSSENINPGDPYMKPADFEALANNGLNALHLYTASPGWGHPPEYRVAYVDYLVDQAARHGLYLVMTVGEVDSRPAVFPLHAQFIHDFWEFYAERYKNEQHVIFEICNEIGSEDRNQMIAAEADAYQTIRAHAPDSMVLLYSFAVTDAVDWLIGFIEETDVLVGGILWTNEAIAFHAYEAREDLTKQFGGEKHLRQVIREFRRSGYPLINTEVPNVYELTPYLDMMMMRVFEAEGVSWLAFTEYPRVQRRSLWRGRFDAVGLTWRSDYGSWPVTKGTFPFKAHTATMAAVAASAKRTAGPRPVFRFTNGKYVRYLKLRFGTREPILFKAKVKSTGPGRLFVRRGGPQGPVLGSLKIKRTSSKYRTITIPLTKAVSGLTDISITYKTRYQNSSLSLRQWSFALPALSTYQDPYRKYTRAANYPFQSGKIVRRASTDKGSAARFEVGGITDGGSLTYDFVRFNNQDAELRIRAKVLAGGSIDIWVGDMAAWSTQVGTCQITGVKNVWREFKCPLKLSDVLMVGDRDTYWDLDLVFNSGPGVRRDAELFAISRYYIIELP